MILANNTFTFFTRHYIRTLNISMRSLAATFFIKFENFPFYIKMNFLEDFGYNFFNYNLLTFVCHWYSGSTVKQDIVFKEKEKRTLEIQVM